MLGRRDINPGASQVPDTYGILLPQSGGDWEFRDVPVENCDEMSRFVEVLCRFFPCPGDKYRPLEVQSNTAWFPAVRKLISVDLSENNPTVSSYNWTSGIIDEMRLDDYYLYVVYRTGSGEIFNVSNPEMPVLTGTHTLNSWVNGVYYSQSDAFRRVGTTIETAIGAVP